MVGEEPTIGERSVKVTDILTKKGPRIVTVKASESIGALSALLREKLVGAAVVSEDGQSVDGVISERCRLRAEHP